jgi:hypothetical protein
VRSLALCHTMVSPRGAAPKPVAAAHAAVRHLSPLRRRTQPCGTTWTRRRPAPAMAWRARIRACHGLAGSRTPHAMPPRMPCGVRQPPRMPCPHAPAACLPNPPRAHAESVRGCCACLNTSSYIIARLNFFIQNSTFAFQGSSSNHVQDARLS